MLFSRLSELVQLCGPAFAVPRTIMPRIGSGAARPPPGHGRRDTVGASQMQQTPVRHPAKLVSQAFLQDHAEHDFVLTSLSAFRRSDVRQLFACTLLKPCVTPACYPPLLCVIAVDSGYDNAVAAPSRVAC
jgi:hypothetical protein